MAFQFPANPTLGQQYAPATGTTYEWNGTGWIFLGLNTASLYPAGIILPYAGAESLPFQGWLLCDGKSYATSAQPALFAVINYYYGGSGANFNVPDLRGRVVAGADSMGGTAANRLTVLGGLTGAGGAQHIALSTGELPSHNHGINDGGHAHGVSDPTHAHGVYDPSHEHGVGVSDPGHAHGVNDGGHAHGYNDPGHTHPYQYSTNQQGGDTYAMQGGGPSAIYSQYANVGGAATNITIAGSGANIGIQGSGTGISVDIHHAGTGIGIYGAGTGISIQGSGANISTQATGSGGGHLNVQPTIVLNYLIKA